ncbi:pilus assembly FimT family protein [Acinetobacter chinensis]|uniref:pilus assembly FimT family protein n=1 Tax=Acinetobacter chinensis TaxID=2004650 RepID=UPI001D0D9183|nr:prepilin-type N-terminal cleavage/methylation domain-containing protein [Acinetobacter chinensis]
MLVKQNQGFTLIELMVTVAVLAIIVMAAAPSFGDMMERQQLNSSTQNLVGILSQARAQATLIRSDVQVEILSFSE